MIFDGLQGERDFSNAFMTEKGLFVFVEQCAVCHKLDLHSIRIAQIENFRKFGMVERFALDMQIYEGSMRLDFF